MKKKRIVVECCAIAVACSTTIITPAHANYCSYREGYPVWHFLPAEAVRIDTADVPLDPDGDPDIDAIVQSILSQQSYLNDRGGRSNRYTELSIAEGKRQVDEFFALLEDVVEGEDQQLSHHCKKTLALSLALKDDGLNPRQVVYAELTDQERSAVDGAANALVTALDGWSFSDLWSYLEEFGLESIPLACKSDTEFVESLGAELTQFEDGESSRPGPSATAQIPYGAALNPDWHYLRVTLAQSNLAYSRRWFSSYYPGVFTSIRLDSHNGSVEALGIQTDASNYKLDERRVRRTLVRNQVIVPPTPYIGGDFQMNAAIVGVESYNYATQFFDFLNSLTDNIGSKLLSEVQPLYGFIEDGIEYLSVTDGDTQHLEAGVALDLETPRTGYWLLLWPSKEFMTAYSVTDDCPDPARRPERGVLSRLVSNRNGKGDAFAIDKDMFRLVRTSEGAGADGLMLLVRQNVDKSDEDGKRNRKKEYENDRPEALIKPTPPTRPTPPSPPPEASGEIALKTADDLALYEQALQLYAEQQDSYDQKMAEFREREAEYERERKKYNEAILAKHYEPLNNTSWALLRVDALRLNPNWRRVNGLTAARRTVLETMVSKYLPSFTETRQSGNAASTSDNENGAQNGAGESSGTDGNAAGNSERRSDDTPEGTTTNSPTFVPQGGTVEEKLKQAIQFYLNLLTVTPDLLEYDKYRIIDQEVRRFERYEHVLAAADTRQAILKEAYERMRKKAKRDAFDAIDDRFGKEVTGNEDAQKPENSDETDENKTNIGSDADANAINPQNVSSLALSLGRPDFTPEVALANLAATSYRLSDAVDDYLAKNPIAATRADYRGIDSIDSEMILHVAQHQDAHAVRSELIDLYTDILMGVWAADKDAESWENAVSADPPSTPLPVQPR